MGNINLLFCSFWEQSRDVCCSLEVSYRLWWCYVFGGPVQSPLYGTCLQTGAWRSWWYEEVYIKGEWTHLLNMKLFKNCFAFLWSKFFLFRRDPSDGAFSVEDSKQGVIKVIKVMTKFSIGIHSPLNEMCRTFHLYAFPKCIYFPDGEATLSNMF